MRCRKRKSGSNTKVTLVHALVRLAEEVFAPCRLIFRPGVIDISIFLPRQGIGSDVPGLTELSQLDLDLNNFRGCHPRIS